MKILWPRFNGTPPNPATGNRRPFELEIMKMNRRSFAKQAFSTLALGSTSGCSFIRYVTAEKPGTFTEQISSVLISDDDQVLVAMTKRFHYIFFGQSALAFALKGKLHSYLRAKFSSFYVRPRGGTSGIVELTISDAPDDVLAQAMSQGFISTPAGLIFSKMLEGKRYDAGDVPVLLQYALNKTYDVEVRVERGPSLLKTPIYVINGTLYIAGTVLMVPLWLAFWITSPRHPPGDRAE
jgi:hypothetical protein